MASNRTCEHCMHWHAEAIQRAEMGRCKRFPPGWFMSVEYVNKGDSQKQVYVSQPIAMSYDTCGEWVERISREAPQADSAELTKSTDTKG